MGTTINPSLALLAIQLFDAYLLEFLQGLKLGLESMYHVKSHMMDISANFVLTLKF